MPWSRSINLSRFFQALQDTDSSTDMTFARDYVARVPESIQEALAEEFTNLLSLPTIPLTELGTVSNRWFGDEIEARAWLESLLSVFATVGSQSSRSVKDCNGAVLEEGDSVSVIKDLKVKGGSSDLKRGATIRKIHLIDDPDAVECRVGGSTLVLKTCFLKKVSTT